MKRLMIIVSVAFAFAAFAEESEGVRRGPRGNGTAHGMTAGERGLPGRAGLGFAPSSDSTVMAVANPKVAEEIGLSQEVRDQIGKIDQDYRKELKDLQAKTRAAMEKQTDLMKAAKPDEAAVMAAIDELFDCRKAMAKIQTRRVIAVKCLLTPEQLEKARTAVRKQREDRRGRRPAARRPESPAPVAQKVGDKGVD